MQHGILKLQWAQLMITSLVHILYLTQSSAEQSLYPIFMAWFFFLGTVPTFYCVFFSFQMVEFVICFFNDAVA